jgi:hypothetical protein
VLRKTKYATELARAEHGQSRIERLAITGGEEEVRFSWWRDDQLIPRPLDLPERELLPLLREAMRQGVFTPEFLAGLRDALNEFVPEQTT